MKSQRTWVLLVSFLLVSGMIRGAEKPQPDVKAAMEKAVAAQKECNQRLGLPVEITNSIGMKLRLIPAGEFMMGSPESDDEAKGSEKPQHKVRITKPFYLGVYEVTQAEYERVMGTNPSDFSKNGDNSDAVKDMDTSRFPVEDVSWEGAVEFCRKLSELPEEKAGGRIYRLPTEAEWEYACRAGTTTPFHFGSQLNGQEANCDGNYPYGTSTEGPDLGRTTTVGSYAANAFGLYDMHGNVWEWCNDRYAWEYYKSSPENDPLGPTEAADRVVRGGCWWGGAWSCRAAIRYGLVPLSRLGSLGFRVAAVPSGKSSQEQASKQAEPGA